MHETRAVQGAEDAHRRLLDSGEQEGYEPSKVVCFCHQHHDLNIQIVVGAARAETTTTERYSPRSEESNATTIRHCLFPSQKGECSRTPHGIKGKPCGLLRNPGPHAGYSTRAVSLGWKNGVGDTLTSTHVCQYDGQTTSGLQDHASLFASRSLSTGRATASTAVTAR